MNFGYLIKFDSLPLLGTRKIASFSVTLQEEVSTLLQKHAIVQLASFDLYKGFYSKYFTVRKKDGGLRPILDLRDLK